MILPSSTALFWVLILCASIHSGGGQTEAVRMESSPAFQFLSRCHNPTSALRACQNDAGITSAPQTRRGAAARTSVVACENMQPGMSDSGRKLEDSRSLGLGVVAPVQRRRILCQTGAALAALVTPVEQAHADAVAKGQRKKQRTGQQEKKPRLESEREGGRVLYEAIGGVRPAALVVVVGGFMIPSFQYDSYARALQGLGYSVLLFEDKSTITEPKPLKESVRVLLGQLKEAIQAHHQRALFSAAPSPADRVQSIKRIMRAEARAAVSRTAVSTGMSAGSVASAAQSASSLGFGQSASVGEEPLSDAQALDEDPPVIFVGHSRGAKICNLAAKACPWKVAAMVLLDPVDSTSFEPEETLSVLASLRVPTAIIGGAGDPSGLCAPLDANYNAFYETLARAGAPRLLAEIGAAGHTQFLDVRGALLDPCSAGPVDDAFVREIALAVAASWISVWCPMVVSTLPPDEQVSWEKARKTVNRELAFERLVERVSKQDLKEQLEQYRWQTPVRFIAGGRGM